MAAFLSKTDLQIIYLSLDIIHSAFCLYATAAAYLSLVKYGKICKKDFTASSLCLQAVLFQYLFMGQLIICMSLISCLSRISLTCLSYSTKHPAKVKCEAVLYREKYMLKYNFISYLMEGKNYIH